MNAMAPQPIGATRKTNNTAEPASAIKALLWLLSQALGHVRACIPLGSRVRMIFDSVYVVGLINGKFSPKRNIMMAVTLQFLWRWRLAHQFYTFGQAEWTNVHAGNVGNERADILAKLGDVMT